MIDRTFGAGTDRGGLTDQEIVAIRQMAHGSPVDSEELVKTLSEEFQVSTDIILKVLEGEIAPYAGGPLRPLPLQGCNPHFLESTRNRQRFVRGVMLEARVLLSAEEFEVFCHFNGMTVDQADSYLGNVGPVHDRGVEKFRSIVRRHAEGLTIEQAVSAHSKKARVNAG